MSDLFYIFEQGSGSTWGRYVVPADSYRVELGCNARVGLSPANYGASVTFSSIDKKTFKVVHAADLAGVLCQEIIHGAPP